jgi:hypothetical protein
LVEMECKYRLASAMIHLPGEVHRRLVESLDPLDSFESAQDFGDHLDEAIESLKEEREPEDVPEQPIVESRVVPGISMVARVLGG